MEKKSFEMCEYTSPVVKEFEVRSEGIMATSGEGKDGNDLGED